MFSLYFYFKVFINVLYDKVHPLNMDEFDPDTGYRIVKPENPRKIKNVPFVYYIQDEHIIMALSRNANGEIIKEDNLTYPECTGTLKKSFPYKKEE